jgi:hypothetical protein
VAGFGLPGDVVGDVRDREGLVVVEKTAEGSGTGAQGGSEAYLLRRVGVPGTDVQVRVGGFERGDAGAQSGVEDEERRQLWSMLEIGGGRVRPGHGAT